MDSNLINGKVELVPWFKTWFVKLFGFVFGNMKVLEWPLSRKWDSMVTSLRNEKEWNECNLLSNEIKKQMSTMDLVWISL